MMIHINLSSDHRATSKVCVCGGGGGGEKGRTD